MQDDSFGRAILLVSLRLAFELAILGFRIARVFQGRVPDAGRGSGKPWQCEPFSLRPSVEALASENIAQNDQCDIP
jgi:hypothetical protein